MNKAYYDFPLILLNTSVEALFGMGYNIEQISKYVKKSVVKDFYEQNREWIDKIKPNKAVLTVDDWSKK